MCIAVQVEEPLNMRSDVGAAVSMEVRVSNAHSTDISEATVDIFYPARAQETGDLFYLLPDCRVSGSITVRTAPSLSLSLIFHATTPLLLSFLCSLLNSARFSPPPTFLHL